LAALIVASGTLAAIALVSGIAAASYLMSRAVG
jgi:hypothetical protein